MTFPSIRIAKSSGEPSFEASKWLKLPVLLDAEEMGGLFKEMGEFSIFLTGQVQQKGQGMISHADFLQCYADYVRDLQAGKIPEDSRYRSYFSSVMTSDTNALYLLPVGTDSDRYLIRVSKPVIQLQAHTFDYSREDGKYRSMVLGNTVSWGIQFSFPQMYLNPQTKQIESIAERKDDPNSALFRRLQKWVRNHTLATPFVVGGKKTAVPIRLGKQCFSWINDHIQLKERGIQVLV